MVSDSSNGRVLFGANREFNGVKVFSATMVADRDRLGDKVTEWVARHPKIEVREIVVTQSSDKAFHCLAMTVFYWEESLSGS